MGKPFLVQRGFPVPKYKYSLKDETEKSRNSFIQVSDQILSDENFLKLVKSKFINFKTTNGIKIKGDNFKINKTKQNQPELSFEISIEQFNKIPLEFSATSDLEDEEISKEQELINKIWQAV